jgi:hypothetical protein
MRNGIKPASLGELMGKGFEHRDKLTLEDLPKLLGEKMPHMEYNRVGRVRLVNALHQRFGPGFRNIPGVQDIMNEFDKEISVDSAVKANHKLNSMRSKKEYAMGGKVECYDEGGQVKKPGDNDTISSIASKIGSYLSSDDDSDSKPKKQATPVPSIDQKKAKAYGFDIFKAKGGLIPGDHPKNDIVPAMLSPGEIVIPRSITMHPDAANLAKAFVAKQLKKHRG